MSIFGVGPRFVLWSALFSAAGIRRAVVFDGKEIIGILSNTDIFNAIEV